MREITDELTLSYSSANLLRGCERRYMHYKVEKTPYDSDYEEDSTALIIGKSLHFILENTLHSKPKAVDDFLKLCTDNFKLAAEDYPLVHGMLIKYLRLHKLSGLECISVEDEIRNDFLVGYIDAVMRDKAGNWYVVDLKTAATLSQNLLPKLYHDTQLNLYASFAKDIAVKYNLDFKKFKGCRYRLVTKSKATMRAGEDRVSFTTRIVDLIKAYDFILPIEKMNPSAFLNEHKRLWLRSLQIRETKESCQNFAYCDSYFRACPYWSKCHGKPFSELKDEVKTISL